VPFADPGSDPIVVLLAAKQCASRWSDVELFQSEFKEKLTVIDTRFKVTQWHAVLNLNFVTFDSFSFDCLEFLPDF
jgi:hypothetical protein